LKQTFEVPLHKEPAGSHAPRQGVICSLLSSDVPSLVPRDESYRFFHLICVYGAPNCGIVKDGRRSQRSLSPARMRFRVGFCSHFCDWGVQMQSFSRLERRIMTQKMATCCKSSCNAEHDEGVAGPWLMLPQDRCLSGYVSRCIKQYYCRIW
jgi:hypothetical protein